MATKFQKPNGVGSINGHVIAVPISERPATAIFHARSVLIAGDCVHTSDLAKATTTPPTLIRLMWAERKKLVKMKAQG